VCGQSTAAPSFSSSRFSPAPAQPCPRARSLRTRLLWGRSARSMATCSPPPAPGPVFAGPLLAALPSSSLPGGRAPLPPGAAASCANRASGRDPCGTGRNRPLPPETRPGPGAPCGTGPCPQRHGPGPAPDGFYKTPLWVLYLGSPHTEPAPALTHSSSTLQGSNTNSLFQACGGSERIRLPSSLFYK